jgi:folate-binding protein YgfZ
MIIVRAYIGEIHMGKKHLQSLTLDADALKVSGPDAFHFLQGMLTADIRRGLRTGSWSPYGGGSFLLDQKAKIVAPSKYWVFKDQELYLSLPTGLAPGVAEELERFHVADELEIEVPATKPWAYQLLIRAPGVFPRQEIPGPGEGARDRVFELGHQSWGFSLALPEWGEDFFQLWVKDEKAFESEFATQPFARPEIEALRMKSGVPAWGVDYSRDSLVLEYPHANDISFFKGCYKGQEIVARATYRGTMQKSFVRFQAEPGQVLEPGFVYNSEEPEKAVGKITSAQGESGLGLVRLAASTHGRLFVGESPAKRIWISRVERLVQESP